MELRGCSHLHFISVIRGSEVIKVPNISRERKVLKFKNVVEIYVSNDSRCHDSTSKPPKVDRSLATPYECVKVKPEVKIEPTEEQSELDFDVMTLKQLQRTCKSKKRKTSKADNSAAVKREANDIQLEDGLELKETLGSLKRKLFKKRKTKRNGVKICASISSDTFCLGGKSNDIPTDLAVPETVEKNIQPVRFKIEEAAPDYSQPQAISCIIDDEPRNIMPIMAVQGDANLCCTGRDVQTTLETQSCSLNQVSYEHLEGQSCSLSQVSHELLETQSCSLNQIEEDYSQPQAISCILNDDPRNLTPIMAIQGAVNLNCTDRDFQASLESQSCSLSQVSYEQTQGQSRSISQVSQGHVQYFQLQTALLSEDSRNEDILQLDSAAVIGDQPPVLTVSNLRKVEDMTDLVIYDEAPETVVLECGNSGALCIPPYTYETMEVEVPGPGPGPANDCATVAVIGNGKASGFTPKNKNLNVEVIRTVSDCSTTLESLEFLPSANNVAPKDTFASKVEEAKLSTLDLTVAPLRCYPDIQPCNALYEVTESAANEFEDKKMPHSPERLFSTRQAISPNAQEKLRRAMCSNDLQHDKETRSCREILVFDRDCKQRSSSSPSDAMTDQNSFTSKKTEASKAEMTTIPRQTRKGIDQRKGLHARGIVKGRHASHFLQRAATGCSSVKTCSQNAIEFSQQQMHDIERIALKLVTELQSMKEIVVDALHSESRAGAKSRCNMDKVRVAVENANKVEEASKKLLSTMTRDCNRFCKIMSLAESDAASPEKTVQKERKKIMFADEAGESLCHVKVFHSGVGVPSPVESPVEKV